MERKIYINKVVFTAEAICDYEEEMRLGALPKKDIKRETEEYLAYTELAGKLICCRYFRINYFDEGSDKMLMLFFYKGATLGNMQMWRLSGICLAEDWNEELEDDGLVRNWLVTKIEDLPEEEDWVERYNKYLKEKEELWNDEAAN